MEAGLARRAMSRPRSGIVRGISATLLSFGLAAPDTALACTNCGLRDSAPGRSLLLWGMILLPWCVVGASLLVIRRVTKAEEPAEAGPLNDSSDDVESYEGR